MNQPVATPTTNENWRQIPGAHPGYEVSNLGRVRSWLGRGRCASLRGEPAIRKLRPGKKDGYLGLILTGSGRKATFAKAHLLVITAFVGPKPFVGAECRHLDGNQHNNRFDNLAWGTHAENCQDQVRHGTDTRAERNGGAKLTNKQAVAIRVSAESGKELALRHGVSQATISRIRHGVRYACATAAA